MAAPCPHCGRTDGHEKTCPATQLDLIGQVLDGRFKIEEVIGQGGMGLVFRGLQTSMQRPVAIKTLYPGLAAAPQFFERFRREAEVASRLRHPNVITVYDFGCAQDGTCYYVMELLEGESLRQLVRREGPLSLRRAVALIEQACRGLAHAHEQGCAHRDIKPHNIMVHQLDGKDSVKVLDFGLVKALEQEDDEQLTTTGQVLGTPQYMSPEQAGGDGADHRSDLYSMAGVLYYCLTGSSPYGANTVRKALSATLTQPIPTVATKRQGVPVPGSVEDFFQKGLAREKEDRFQSAEEFIQGMLAAVAGLPDEVLDARPPRLESQAQSNPHKSTRGSGSSSSAAWPKLLSPQPAAGSALRGRATAETPTPRLTLKETLQTEALSEFAPPGRGKSHRWVLAVVVVVMSGLAGAALALRTSPSALAPRAPSAAGTAAGTAPVSPPPSSHVKVLIRSTPEGATIFHSGSQIGSTPTELLLARDKAHTLTFQLAGYKPVQRTLDYSLLATDTDTVSVVLVRSEPPPPSRPSRPSKEQGQEDISIFE